MNEPACHLCQFLDQEHARQHLGWDLGKEGTGSAVKEVWTLAREGFEGPRSIAYGQRHSRRSLSFLLPGVTKRSNELNDLISCPEVTQIIGVQG